jgi:hypothetical protein
MISGQRWRLSPRSVRHLSGALAVSACLVLGAGEATDMGSRRHA